MIALAWHPLRLVIPAIILALVAAGMGGKDNRLARAAVIIGTLAFFFGMAIAVAGQRPLSSLVRCYNGRAMSRPDFDRTQRGLAALLLEQYLAPLSVPAEWRTLFEDDPAALLRRAAGPGAAAREARAQRRKRPRRGSCAAARFRPGDRAQRPLLRPRPHPRSTTTSSAASPPRWRW